MTVGIDCPGKANSTRRGCSPTHQEDHVRQGHAALGRRRLDLHLVGGAAHVEIYGAVGL
jgi:hypothetical protein